MLNRTALASDPIAFLTETGNGETTREYRYKQVVFSQGDAADAVFYIQSGNVQLTVVSPRGREAVMVGTTRSRVSYFMNRSRKMGFIHCNGYNGGLQVHGALLTVVLRD